MCRHAVRGRLLTPLLGTPPPGAPGQTHIAILDDTPGGAIWGASGVGFHCDAGQKQAPRAGRGLDLLGLLQEPVRRRGQPGFNPVGTRQRRKVTGRTKAEVRDKLRELHREANSGFRPRQSYTVGDALDDWLAHGLDGLSARTVILYKDTIVVAVKEQLGPVKLSDLRATQVQSALTALAARRSSRTVQIARNVLVRAIRQVERDGLVARNVAALVRPPKGQRAGRPSKALTLDQATALIEAAQGTRLEAYVTVSLLAGIRTEEARALRWDHVVV
jgi:hypothetical protein